MEKTNEVNSSRPKYKPVVDGGWGWIVVLGSFFIHVFADGIVYSFGVLLEVIMKDFGASNAKASVIISLLTGLTLGTGPIASAVTNKFGCRLTTIAGSLIASVGCASSYYATSVEYLMVSVGCVMGLGFGLMYCPAIVAVTIYFEKKRAMATGIAVCGAGVGTVLFAPISEQLITLFSWRTVFIAYTIVVLLCSACGSLFRPLQFVEVPTEMKELKSNSEKDENEEESKEGKEESEKLKIIENSNTFEKNQFLEPKIRAAYSQVAVNGKSKETGKIFRTRSMCDYMPRTRKTVTGSIGFINVQDVFFWGSTTALPEIRNNKKEHVIPLENEIISETEKMLAVTTDEELHKTHKAIDMWRTFVRMTDMKLLLDPVFLLFAVSNLLTSIAFNSPLVFLPAHVIQLGCSPTEAARVLSMFGLFNTVGRIMFGLISDRQLPTKYGKDTARNRLCIYVISMAICGTLTTFVFLCKDFIALMVYSGLFGLTLSSYVCLTSVLLVDLIGIERLTNAFGLLLLFQGMGTVIGPPISGELADQTKTYNWSFVFCGISLLLSGLMLFLVPILQKRWAKKAEEKRQLALISSSA